MIENSFPFVDSTLGQYRMVYCRNRPKVIDNNVPAHTRMRARTRARNKYLK